MDLVIVGSLAVDKIWIPYSDKPYEMLGGSALYSAIAASKFDVDIGIVGVLGADRYDNFCEIFDKVGIDISGIGKEDGRTFFWEGQYLPDMNKRKTLSLDLGVFADFVPRIPENYKNCGCLFLANISPDLQWQILESVNPDFVAMDTMDHWIISYKEEVIKLLSKVNIFFLNEEEAYLLSEEKNIFKAGHKILTYMPGDGMVIIKRGDSGAVWMSGIDKRFVASYPVEDVKDPTGAGDCFAGAFLAGYITSKRLDEDLENNISSGLIAGTVIASFCVEEIGIHLLENVGINDILERVDLLSRYICRRWDLNPHVRKDTWS